MLGHIPQPEIAAMSIVKCVLVSLTLVLAVPLAAHAADAATVTCKDGASSKGGKGACSGHGGIDKNAPPAGATARCKDGSYYLQKEHKGACGKHGGVDQWLDK
jgi:hypothetical protein